MQKVSRQLRPFLTDEELRGIPMVGGGRQSAVTGSAPERAILEKERRGRLRLGKPDPIVPRMSEEELIGFDRRVRKRKKLGRRVVISTR